MKNRSARDLADAHEEIRRLRNDLDATAQPLRERIRHLEAEVAALNQQRSRDTMQVLVLTERSQFYWRTIAALTALVQHLITRKPEDG